MRRRDSIRASKDKPICHRDPNRSPQAKANVLLERFQPVTRLPPIFLVQATLRATCRLKQHLHVLAAKSLKTSLAIPGAPECMAKAPLIVLRFGSRHSVPKLTKCVEADSGRNTASVVRACALLSASWGIGEYREVRKAASKLLKSPLPKAIRMIERIREYDEVPVRYKARLSLRMDAVAGRLYVDMRGLLTARLLALSSHAAVTKWIRDWIAEVRRSKVSAFDKQLIVRLLC